MEETPRERITVTSSLNELSTDQVENRPGISDQSIGATNREGIGLSYRPARLHRLTERFLGIESSTGSFKEHKKV
jgi:hypothetical protein